MQERIIHAVALPAGFSPIHNFDSEFSRFEKPWEKSKRRAYDLPVSGGALSKQHLRELYRPVGPKVISLGNATPSLATGGQLSFNQQVDLSLPIRGLQLHFRGRDVVGTAGMASLTPEGFLNFISNITIQGVNARQQGNVTLWSASLSSMYSMSHLHAYRGNALYTINSGAGETLVARPSTPFPAAYNPTNNTGTYDFRIVIDIPFHPFEFNAFGNMPFSVPLFGVRNEEWKDSLQVIVTFASQANAAVAGALGTGAAGTTHTFSAYGSGAGSPVIDLYSLPYLSGLSAKDSYLPGVLSRVNYPVSTVLQSAGTGVSIANMQKQPTPRVYVKVGTSTVSEVFATLSDTNVTALGIQLGGNRNIRNVVDIFAHKALTPDDYDVDIVQGYNVLDFVQNGNYDSNFPGQDIGDGATFQLMANVTGVANAAADIIQEQLLHAPTGPLAS